MKATEFITESVTPLQKKQFLNMFKKFLPLAMQYIKLDRLPKMVFLPSIKDIEQPTFGRYVNDEQTLYVALSNRHPVDILRTIAHELQHYKQDTDHALNTDSGATGSREENEANAVAGIVMRHFNKQYPEFLKTYPIVMESKHTNYEIRNLEKLDNLLLKLCEMIIDAQQQDSEYFGMVAAGVLDPDNNFVAAVNYPHESGTRVHAERAAMELYISQRGSSIPEGSIIITTLSPCNEHSDITADGRYGESCTDLINDSTVHKVYCGYTDPSQGDDEHDERTFTLQETNNPHIRRLCKKFADTFLKPE